MVWLAEVEGIRPGLLVEGQGRDNGTHSRLIERACLAVAWLCPSGVQCPESVPAMFTDPWVLSQPCKSQGNPSGLRDPGDACIPLVGSGVALQLWDGTVHTCDLLLLALALLPAGQALPVLLRSRDLVPCPPTFHCRFLLLRAWVTSGLAQGYPVLWA